MTVMTSKGIAHPLKPRATLEPHVSENVPTLF